MLIGYIHKNAFANYREHADESNCIEVETAYPVHYNQYGTLKSKDYVKVAIVEAPKDALELAWESLTNDQRAMLERRFGMKTPRNLSDLKKSLHTMMFDLENVIRKFGEVFAALDEGQLKALKELANENPIDSQGATD